MKLSADIKKCIQEAALDVGLPISVVTGIVCQESSGNPSATRYEPGFFKRYIIKLGLAGEEAQGRATSWGLMQLMGQVAREMGFTAPFETLLDPDVGLYWGCRHLSKLKERHYREYGWAGVIAAYNAGSPRKQKDGKWVNQDYVDKVTKYAQEALGGAS
jgi:soluble lytic murein transglycosylase-like protein